MAKHGDIRQNMAKHQPICAQLVTHYFNNIFKIIFKNIFINTFAQMCCNVGRCLGRCRWLLA